MGNSDVRKYSTGTVYGKHKVSELHHAPSASKQKWLGQEPLHIRAV